MNDRDTAVLLPNGTELAFFKNFTHRRAGRFARSSPSDGPRERSSRSGRTLADRDLRARVAADAASESTRTTRVTGQDHAFRADPQAGIADAERGPLVAYLLSVDRLTQDVPVP